MKQIAQPKKSYFSRYQVKPRRRREGKTDYAKRRKLIRQDVSKLKNPKCRLVIRITNSKVICSIQKACLEGDKVMAYADSTELKKYGITFGLTNYSACYATGLLLGKRILKSFNIDAERNEDVGAYEKEDIDFSCILDIGLRRATKGARVFVAMKGVSDAGVYVPHSPDKFYGFDDEEKLRDRIFGKELVRYMTELRENDMERYKKQFSGYIRMGIEAEKIGEIYRSAFDRINEDFEREKREKKDYSGFKKFKVPKLSYEERKMKVDAKIREIKGEN